MTLRFPYDCKQVFAEGQGKSAASEYNKGGNVAKRQKLSAQRIRELAREEDWQGAVLIQDAIDNCVGLIGLHR